MAEKAQEPGTYMKKRHIQAFSQEFMHRGGEMSIVVGEDGVARAIGGTSNSA